MDYGTHFRLDNFKRYGLQCGLAGIGVLVLLLVLDAVTQTVLIASLGASAFIAFAVPRSLHSGPRHLIGGYVVGMTAGVAMAFLPPDSTEGQQVAIDVRGKDLPGHIVSMPFVG